jgi:hypothetical protein
MILDKFKELNITDEELDKSENIFDKIYSEYIDNNLQNNKNNNKDNYIYKNPINKIKSFVQNNIIKNLKKNDYTHNTSKYNNNGKSKEDYSKKETIKIYHCNTEHKAKYRNTRNINDNNTKYY